MTVAELIVKLRAFPPDLPVTVWHAGLDIETEADEPEARGRAVQRVHIPAGDPRVHL